MPFEPTKDIPSLESKVILITGANSGIGREHVRYLAAHQPAKLYLAARNQTKADEAIADIQRTVPDAKIDFLQLDLSSLAEVKRAADTFRETNDRLDILVNNAGTMGNPAGLTTDGYEVQFGTNHMGHFLLTRELLPVLEATAAKVGEARIINVASLGHQMAPSGGFLPEAATTDMAAFSTWRRYGHSKLANMLFTVELARRHPTVTSVAIHPGTVHTNLGNELVAQYHWLLGSVKSFLGYFMWTSAQGALNQTWASVAPLEKDATSKITVPRVKQGEYYVPVGKVGSRSRESKDKELAKQLWEWSEAEVVKKGY